MQLTCRDRFAQEAIRKAPQNQSPWNYLRGILSRAGLPLSSIKDFAAEFADLDHPDTVRSSHALDFLAEIYGAEGRAQQATQAYQLLATKYDPIRANYWDYLKGQLQHNATAVV